MSQRWRHNSLEPHYSHLLNAIGCEPARVETDFMNGDLHEENRP